MAFFLCHMVISLIYRPGTETGHRCHAPGFIFRSKNFRATVVPAVLISYRTSVINGHEWYSSSDAEHNIHRSFGTYTNQSH